MYLYDNVCVYFFPVPSGLITSVSLSPPNPIGTVGSSVILTCTAIFNVDVSGAVIVFKYGFMNNTIDAVAGNTQTDMATISPVESFSAGEYTCTVTVTVPGVCGEGESEPVCPTKTSDSVTLEVKCKLRSDCLSKVFTICMESYLQLLQLL